MGRFRAAFAFASVAATLGACSLLVDTSGLSGGTTGPDASGADATGNPCVFNTDCASPLICAAGMCRSQCDGDRDCPRGARCVDNAVEGGIVSVCQSAAEGACTVTSECPAPEVCGVDGMCRDACRNSGDCFSGQVCVAMTCADPDELDQDGGLPVRTPDGGGADASDAASDAGFDVQRDAVADAGEGDADARGDAGDASVPGDGGAESGDAGGADADAGPSVITEYPLPTISAHPLGIAAGPTGELWFTENEVNKIGRISLDGGVTEYTIPTNNSAPTGIVRGGDGNMWFTETAGNKIGRINGAGVIAEYPISTVGCAPTGITLGTDGHAWFTENLGNKIGNITITGVIAESLVPTPDSRPTGIAAGPDGNLWFTEAYGSKIGTITTAGTVIGEVPTLATFSYPQQIAAGPDGNMWFTQSGHPKIGKITSSGVITEFDASNGAGIAAGADGSLWFADANSNAIGRITTGGTVSEFPIPSSALPSGIAMGPNGSIWFTEFGNQTIGTLPSGSMCTLGRVTCGATCVPLATDAKNCGICSFACISLHTCSGGLCQ